MSYNPTFTPSEELGDNGLIADLAQLAFYPYEFVKYAYPWGEKESKLEHFDGPDGWQTEVLQEIGVQVRNNMFDGVNPVKPVRILIHSGHGTGKSALGGGWITDWIRSTRANSKGTVTANTKAQLKTKTWIELQKWGKLSVTSHWFNFKAESVTHAHYPEWRIDIQTCNEENSEAFAGQHTAESTSYYLFDEASAVPDKIFEVAEGGLIRGEPMIFLLGNATRNSGVFYEIIRGKKRKYWFVKQVDSREAKMSNKAQIQEWIDEYGLDSDFVRVRVLGEPPKADNLQFITETDLNPALGKVLDPKVYYHAPIILGVDPAWEGDDMHWIVKRQGLMSWIIGKWRHLPYETNGLTTLVAQAINEHQADACFIDTHGVGAGVYDNLCNLGFEPVSVNSNSTDIEKPLQFRNARMEMAWKMRQWLVSGGSVPDDSFVKQDMLAPYCFLIASGTHAGKYIMEAKKDMKKRGLDSPGFFDALNYTFYQPVVRRKHGVDDIEFDFDYGHGVLGNHERAVIKYDVFGRKKRKNSIYGN